MNTVTRVALLVGAAIAALFRGAASQDSTSCSFDTAAHTVMEPVTLSLAALWRAGQSVAARNDYVFAAQAIQTQFQRPEQVRLPLSARTIGRTPQPGTFSTLPLRGLVRFRLDRVGHLADKEIQVDFPSQDVAHNILAAVKRADSANAFPPPSSAVLHDQGFIRLRVEPLPDTVGSNIPLIRLMVPEVLVDSAPAVVSFPPMEYPRELREAGLGDSILLKVLVLSDGSIDPSSLDLLNAQYRETALAVIEHVQNFKFRPARIGGCAVPMFVSLPVAFKIKRF